MNCVLSGHTFLSIILCTEHFFKKTISYLKNRIDLNVAVISCEAIPTANSDSFGQVLHYDEELRLTCRPGYRLVSLQDHVAIRCQADANYNDTGSCEGNLEISAFWR